jgi:copper(I)-binding protein
MHKLIAAAALSVTALAAAPALAHMPGGLEVVQAWSRPAAAGMTGAGYMTIRNHGKAAQTLVKVETPAARKVEVHRTVTSGGISRMEPVPRLVVPPGGEARLVPGGQHLMLMGLAAPLKAGQHVPATLTFDSGVKVRADIVVGTAAPAQGAPSIHNH